MPESPLVSIVCATYNHERLVGEALDGFLVQEVDGAVEILVNDDASTDGTQEVLRQYERRYPARIRVKYHRENQLSRGRRPLAHELLPAARGEFIAVCEGDDYWTDPGKLRKQLDVLRADDTLSACFTDAWKVDEIAGTRTRFVSSLPGGRVPEERIVRAGGGLYPTASLLFRRSRVDSGLFDRLPELPGDEILIYALMASGGVYYLPEVTCVYRRWSGGVYSSIVHDTRAIAERKLRGLPAYDRLMATPEFHRFRRHFAARKSAECLYVLKHLGVRAEPMCVRSLRPLDVARLARHVVLGRIPRRGA